jgi:flagellar basal body-associated protein FliL
VSCGEFVILMIVLGVIAVKVGGPIYLLLNKPESYAALKAAEEAEKARKQQALANVAVGGAHIAKLFMK